MTNSAAAAQLMVKNSNSSSPAATACTTQQQQQQQQQQLLRQETVDMATSITTSGSNDERFPNSSSSPSSAVFIDTGRKSHTNARAPKNVRFPYLTLFSEFLPKLILEVFGGTGAIWGFSEACGWRRPETNWFWRPASLCVGFLFLVRFLRQVRTQHQKMVVQQQQQQLKRKTTKELSSESDLELDVESPMAIQLSKR